MKFDLDLFKMGDFILYESDGKFVGRNIEKTQRQKHFSKEDAKFIHVECSGGGPRSVYIRAPKSKAVDIRKAHAGRNIKIVRYTGYTEENRHLRYKVAYNSALLCNLPYDWFGVLKFKIPFLFQKKNVPFCSEGCIWAHRELFPDTLEGLEDHEVMPAHFLHEDYFEVIWEGRIPPIEKSKIKWNITPIKKSLFGEELKYGAKLGFSF